MPALLFLGFPPFPPVGKRLLIGRVSSMEDVGERQAGATVEVRETRFGEQPVRRPCDPRGAGDKRTTLVQGRTVGERAGESVQEPASTDVGGCEEQQRGQERVMFTPGIRGCVGGVERGLGS